MLSRYKAVLPYATTIVLFLLFSAGPGLTQSSMVIYTDVTSSINGGLPGTLTESLAWGDYDNDGDQDLYLTNANTANVLLRNDGNDLFTDVTAITGVGDAGFGVGTAFADLDNDGDLDLYVVNFLNGVDDVLYRNDGPVGTGGEYLFSDITVAAGTTIQSSSRGIALIDYNRDGLLDIYVNAIGQDILYKNLGGLTFSDAAPTLGINNGGQGVGVVATDLDRDGWVDLFTGNRSSDPNRLYLNNQTSLLDITAAGGITKTGLGMGVHSFDYDNDLDFDLYWTTWPAVSNAFYENLDGSSFVEVATASETTDPLGWGISVNAGDIDNDGWEDFFVTNGSDVTTTPNVLYQNDRDKTFSDATSVIGGGAFDGRGVAFADYDNDGDLDLCVTADDPDLTRLWRNDSNNGNQWITLELEGTCSNRSAIGARIEVTTDLATTVKEVSSGAGRGSFNSLPVEFGLGLATAIPRIRIYWPSGIAQTLTDVTPGQILQLSEPCDRLTLFGEPAGLLWARPHHLIQIDYDVVRGDLTTLRSTAGDFMQATESCLVQEHPENFLVSTQDPAAGEGYWFLVREVINRVPSTFDEPSGSQITSRDLGISLSLGACI